MDVSKLVSDLSANGVESFEGYGLKITFKQKPQPTHTSGYSHVQQAYPDSKTEQPQIDPNDKGLAQTLEGELSYDKILHWSTQPDGSEVTQTGDSEPLVNV